MPELSTLGSVIKTAYEAEPDTNAFTDTEKAKLAGLANVATTGSYNDLTGKPTIPSGNYADLTGKPVLSPVATSGAYSDLSGKPDVLLRSERGAPNGIAPLDAAGLVPVVHLNVSGLTFKGAWNPTTNTPTLLDGVGAVGDFYKASEAGTFNFGNSSYTFNMGDWAIFAAGVWQRIGSNELVQSVNGQLGDVVLSAADVGALPDDYVPTWGDLTDKPSSFVTSFNGSGGAVTYAPAWDDIADKPDVFVPRGSMSPAVPAALLRRSSATTLPSGSRQTIPWNDVVYDNFGGVSGSTYIVPAWAGFARVTVFARLTVTGDGGYLYAYALHNGVEIGISGSPVTASTSHNATVISQIVPVSAGDVLTGALYHSSSSGNRTLVHGSTGVYMQIELFEAIT